MNMPNNRTLAMFSRAASAIVMPLARNFRELCENPKAFVSIKGINPVVKNIIGKIMHYAVIQKQGAAVPHDTIYGLNAIGGLVPIVA